MRRFHTIIAMKAGAAPEEIGDVIRKIEEAGMRALNLLGGDRTVIGGREGVRVE